MEGSLPFIWLLLISVKFSKALLSAYRHYLVPIGISERNKCLSDRNKFLLFKKKKKFGMVQGNYSDSLESQAHF